MDSNEETNSGWNEFQDPRGTPVTSENLRNQEKDGKLRNKSSPAHTGIVKGGPIDTQGIKDNLTARGDVLMLDIDDVGFSYTGDTSDHRTPGMTTAAPTLTTEPSECSLTIPIYSTKQVTPRGIPGTKPNPHRQIFSPSDALDTYRFRDLFPNPELQTEISNRLGKINAGGAFVVDNHITMQGDVMMLDLDSEDEGHSDQTYSAVEKFSQLTETARSVTKPTNAPRTTTGIRHLMSIRNPDLAELQNGNHSNPEKKKRRKKKSKHVKNTKNVARVSETQDAEEPDSCVVPRPQDVDVIEINTKTEKKPIGFAEKLRHQMSRFRVYIHQKMICH